MKLQYETKQKERLILLNSINITKKSIKALCLTIRLDIKRLISHIETLEAQEERYKNL